MNSIKFLLTTLLSIIVLNVHGQTLSKGVSKDLADHRKANISNVIYDLTFNIPANMSEKVTGKNVITFDLEEKTDVILDFQGGFNGTCYVISGKRAKRRQAVATYQNEHIVIPMKYLQEGTNKVELSFTCLDKALNRHQDYMYTLFVPDHARSAYPCFDQPDLRARYLTEINAPKGWKTITSDGCCPLPTYLYSFAAGNFFEKTGTRDGRVMRALYRETDPEKVAQLDRVFDEAAQALKWMEGYTGIANPFADKYGILILPGYQFGGMEHPGAIHLNDRRIFLDKNATQEELLSRSELIAHETAHLWFGDLVAMKWFEDVWAKEVFANFMASKITRRQYNKVDHDLNFIKTYQAKAIAIDRTEGTHPIAQELQNINHASLLYDNIIYDKAPVMMRMLEDMMEAPVMQRGLQAYLADNAYDNASWDDLIKALEKVAPTLGIRQFSDVWVKQKGMPVINTTYRDGQIIVTQTDPYRRGICWPQKFQIKLIYDLGTSRTLTVDMDRPVVTFNVVRKPDFIIPNYNGRGYGYFTLDDEYTQKMPLRLLTTRSDLNRYALLLTIHDNYLRGKVTPSYFGELYRMMSKEKNPLIMSTAIDHMFKIASDMTMEQRKTLELCMMDLLDENRSKECRLLIIRKLAANAVSPEVLEKISKLLNAHSDPAFNEHDYMEMAYHLAIMYPDQREDILSKERAYLKTEELRNEFDYVSRACDPNAEARTKVFNSLLEPENRQHEPWALHLLRLLNTDIYEPHSNLYISSSLKSLPYIQTTSDIFFPANWMKNLLAGHKSEEARQMIERFLKSDKTLSDNLKNKVLDAAWVLMKQEPYQEKIKAKVVNNSKSTVMQKTSTNTSTKNNNKKKK
jgi:aminopeptidase N